MAVFVIIAIFVIGLLLIATENVNRINKAAVAMFMGVCCWLLYIVYGTEFVISEHPIDFLSYLSNNTLSNRSVKDFIANSVFLPYLANAAGIVLFLIGTMTIVEVLNNNGCFDFIQEWLRTRNPKRFLWTSAGITFLLSANLDNLTTACMMLAIMHTMIANERQRMLFGSVIVLAANCGGAFTVIGDVSGLTLWANGLVTPTVYARTLLLPCMAALATTGILISRKLPSRLEWVHTAPPYRGDDTVLSRPQRLLLLLVGIGGLWFIPTFHRITLLPPFLGALCVLSLLWIVNELCNRSLMRSDKMIRKRQPIAIQYMSIQNILFFIGITLTLAAINETGALERFFNWSFSRFNDIYIIGAFMGFLSGIFNNVAVIIANISFFSQDLIYAHPELTHSFGEDGIFWPLLSYSSALGGSLLSIGTMAGFALMKMENVTLRWYVRHISGKILAGWSVGALLLYFMTA